MVVRTNLHSHIIRGIFLHVLNVLVGVEAFIFYPRHAYLHHLDPILHRLGWILSA